ncbi:hypothetical protein Pmar_PMAR023387, partial [Perkinsus marinus ATCC 50983]
PSGDGSPYPEISWACWQHTLLDGQRTTDHHRPGHGTRRRLLLQSVVGATW